MDDKYSMQDKQYSFPYHYLSYFKDGSVPMISRAIFNGWKYLTYQDFINKYVSEELDVKSVLDVGCGDGYFLNNFDNDRIVEKRGIDLSENSIKFARAFSKNTQFDVEDIENVNKKYELVTCIEVIEHIPDEMLRSFIDNLVRVVAEDGYLIISVPSTVTRLNKKHYRHYTEELVDEQINNKELKKIKQLRLYKKSKMLDFFQKILCNDKILINIKPFIKFVWNWHKKNTYFADKKTGRHIVTVYKKDSNK